MCIEQNFCVLYNDNCAFNEVRCETKGFVTFIALNIYVYIYVYFVSLYLYVPDEGSLLPKYRDCTTYNDFEYI